MRCHCQHCDDLTLKLTLRLRTDIQTRQCYRRLPLTPIWPLHQPVTLCLMLLERKTHSPDPVWHRFDICIYTKNAHDHVMHGIPHSDAVIAIQEQKFKAWPHSPVKLKLNGDGVVALMEGRGGFYTPIFGEEFQEVFPVYFKKMQRSENPIRLNLQVKPTDFAPIKVSVLFNWNSYWRKPKVQTTVTNIDVTGESAIAIQNNTRVLKRNKTYPDLFSDDERHALRTQHSNESSEPSSLSSTGTDHLYYTTFENAPAKNGKSSDVSSNETDTGDNLILEFEKGQNYDAEHQNYEKSAQAEYAEETPIRSPQDGTFGTFTHSEIDKVHTEIAENHKPDSLGDETPQCDKSTTEMIPSMEESWICPDEEDDMHDICGKQGDFN